MAFVVADPLAQTFIFYSSVLALKLLAVAFLTGYKRKTKGTDAEIENAKKAHLNDLENIPVFWVLGALYLTTDPFVWWASMLFRIFTIARVIHTLVYAVLPVPQQPMRGLAWFASYLVNIYMGVQIMLYYLTAM